MEAGRVLVMGALVANPDRWEKFSDEWQERLDVAPWNVFKMAEVWDRGGDQSMECAKWHYYTIRDHVQGGIAVAIPIKPLEAAANDFDLPQLKNPYIWGIKGMINFTAQFQREWGLHEPVDFIFDERNEEREVRAAWDIYVATIPPLERQVTGRKPMFEDDEHVLPLQGADMWAWWCRRQWLERGDFTHDEFPILWGKTGDIPRMSCTWGEPDIRKEFSMIRAALEAGEIVF